jgi:hypothetical protein
MRERSSASKRDGRTTLDDQRGDDQGDKRLTKVSSSLAHEGPSSSDGLRVMELVAIGFAASGRIGLRMGHSKMEAREVGPLA